MSGFHLLELWILTDSDNLPGLQEMIEDLCDAQKLFPPSYAVSHLSGFLSTFSSNLRNISKNKKHFILALNYLQICLKRQYREVESGLPVSVNLDASNDAIYKTFKDTFNACRTLSPDFTLIFLPQVHADLIKGLKREGEEQTGGPASKRTAVI